MTGSDVLNAEYTQIRRVLAAISSHKTPSTFQMRTFGHTLLISSTTPFVAPLKVNCLTSLATHLNTLFPNNGRRCIPHLQMLDLRRQRKKAASEYVVERVRRSVDVFQAEMAEVGKEQVRINVLEEGVEHRTHRKGYTFLRSIDPSLNGVCANGSRLKLECDSAACISVVDGRFALGRFWRSSSRVLVAARMGIEEVDNGAENWDARQDRRLPNNWYRVPAAANAKVP
ncbi:hypothetical protein C8F01DRAFT_1125692 [Mycena amicta]|nr:hypothetical protein C8F01DRAFT_1125692 [Mycena amicta]